MGDEISAKNRNISIKVEGQNFIDYVDIMNLELKYRFNSGATLSESTPISKDLTKAQFIKLINPNEEGE